MALNVRINDVDAIQLRQHIRLAHPSLMNPVVDGPLPDDLTTVPNDVLIAIHIANHMVPWRDHHADNWKA